MEQLLEKFPDEIPKENPKIQKKSLVLEIYFQRISEEIASIISYRNPEDMFEEIFNRILAEI